MHLGQICLPNDTDSFHDSIYKEDFVLDGKKTGKIHNVPVFSASI